MRPSQRRASIAVACFALALAVWWGVPAWMLRRLVRSTQSQKWRTVDGRVVGFGYRPRSASPVNGESLAVRAAAESIIETPALSPRLRATATLLVGKTDAAAAALEALASKNPDDAGVWSDLAAARIADGGAHDDARSFARALVASDRALRIAPRHAEALFNRALALEQIGLRFAAAGAWKKYLEIDAGSEWAQEARARQAIATVPSDVDLWSASKTELVRALDRGDQSAVAALVARFPLPSRAVIETELLPAWGDAFLSGDAATAAAMSRSASIAANALRSFNGDALTSDALTALNADAARGFQAYRRARAENVARHVKESYDAFTEAEHWLTAAHNPLALSATYYRANALVDLHQTAESKAIARELEPRIGPAHHSLRALLLWLRARHTNDAGLHYESFLATREARQLFERLGESDYAARLRAAEAAMYGRLGRDHEAWQARRVSLVEASRSGRWNNIEAAIDAIAHDEVIAGDPEVARSLFEAELSAPPALPLLHFDALLWLAFLDARSGAPLDLHSLRTAAALIPDARQRDDALSDVRLVSAIWRRDADPDLAERELSQVIDERSRLEASSELPFIYLQRARVRRALSRSDGAERDLRAAIAMIEARRAVISGDSLRDAFLGSAADVYSELGDLLLDRGDWQSAFALAERWRARTLLEKAGRDPLSATQIAAAIRPDTIGVHYTSFATRTLIVVFDRGAVVRYIAPIGRQPLERLRDEMAADPASPAAQRAYEILIAPYDDRLAGHRELRIVPDEATHAIPFAALRDANGRFLVERIALAIAPAATALADAPPRFTAGGQVTIVADPDVSPRIVPALPRLASARDDARAVAAMFPRAHVFSGGEALPETVLPAMRESDLVHIAAHALASSRDASLSFIALSPGADDDGFLYLRDIEPMTFAHHPLIVLAACRTAVLGGGKGSVRSLASAFLAAGSGAVLATTRDVDDRVASEITTRFYANAKRGAPLAEALRDAQLHAMPSVPVAQWSAFQLQVGTAERKGGAASVER